MLAADRPEEVGLAPETGCAPACCPTPQPLSRCAESGAEQPSACGSGTPRPSRGSAGAASPSPLPSTSGRGVGRGRAAQRDGMEGFHSKRSRLRSRHEVAPTSEVFLQAAVRVRSSGRYSTPDATQRPQASCRGRLHQVARPQVGLGRRAHAAGGAHADQVPGFQREEGRDQAIASGTVKIISPAEECWRNSPLTRSASSSAPTSGTSSAVTRYGPMTAKCRTAPASQSKNSSPLRCLQLPTTISRRAEMSLNRT